MRCRSSTQIISYALTLKATPPARRTRLRMMRSFHGCADAGSASIEKRFSSGCPDSRAR